MGFKAAKACEGANARCRPVVICVVQQSLINNHFCPQPGMIADQPAELPEMKICPVHPIHPTTPRHVRYPTDELQLSTSLAYIGATLSS